MRRSFLYWLCLFFSIKINSCFFYLVFFFNWFCGRVIIFFCCRNFFYISSLFFVIEINRCFFRLFQVKCTWTSQFFCRKSLFFSFNNKFSFNLNHFFLYCFYWRDFFSFNFLNCNFFFFSFTNCFNSFGSFNIFLFFNGRRLLCSCSRF